MRRVEILAPAGSAEGIYGALDMGADAVYVGTTRFGARAFADNPGVEELLRALVYAHLRDKKIYLTVNTLLTDRELNEELYPMIKPLYDYGLDACIVQDAGVLDFLHANFPDMDLHASTQMTIFSGEEANLFKPYGVTRYVPARELTIEEIRESRKQTDLEIEVFVHGALCYCYSGQCLMSEQIGGRSGNKGMCAQPCRLSYESLYGRGHFLNTKDTCTLLYIPELVEAGIDSFKIEGRMKRKEYSEGLAWLYRKYTDDYLTYGKEYFDALRKDRKSELWRDYRCAMELFNRGGFSSGFLFEKDKSAMVYPKKNNHFGIEVGTVTSVSRGAAVFLACEDLHYQDVLEFRDEQGISCYEYTVKNPAQQGQYVTANVKKGSRIYIGQNVYRLRNNELLQHIRDCTERSGNDIFLVGDFRAKIGEPARFTVSGRGVAVTEEGPVVQSASSHPVGEDDVRKRIEKIGNTSYAWEQLIICVEPGSFLPLGSLKSLRREAIAAWEKKALSRHDTPVVPGDTSDGKKTSESIMCDDLAGKDNSAGYKDVPMKMISVSSLRQFQAAISCVKNKDVLFHIKLEEVEGRDWSEFGKSDVRIAISIPRVLHGDSRRKFEQLWRRYGSAFSAGVIDAVVIDSHLGYLFAKKFFSGTMWIAGEHFYMENTRAAAFYKRHGIEQGYERTYGRIPVMVSRSCVADTLGLCGQKKRISITTPKGDIFVVENHCQYCYNTVYTKEPVREQTGVRQWFDFTWEEEDSIREVVREWDL